MALNPAIRKAWHDQESFATTLLVLFAETYGTEGLTWSPDTIAIALEHDLGLRVPRHNFDRLMAAIDIVTRNGFYTSTEDFIRLCVVLSGGALDMDTWEPADVAECAWGLTEGLILWPPDEHEDNPFSPEITGYLGFILQSEGFVTPPDIMRIASGMDADTYGRAVDNFSDDPEMFAGIWASAESRTDEIDKAILENLRRLAGQLDALPLQVGETNGVVRKMLAGLANEHRKSVSQQG